MNTINDLLHEQEENLRDVFRSIDHISYENQSRMLDMFRQHKVSPGHFAPGTGYGYNDLGRDTLESIFAQIYGGEDALVRSQLISGTHALSTCLFSLLSPSDLLISACGRPYDTLQRIITGKGGLTEKGVLYCETAIAGDCGCDLEALADAVQQRPKMVLLQRSRGYNGERRSLTINEIEAVIETVKKVDPAIIVLVDNCYGEFVDTREPCQVGADLAAGSLIKNPGGGMAPGGGYIVGRGDLIEKVADYIVAPGLGKEIGPSLYDMRSVYQGVFVAPHVVGEALKGAALMAGVLSSLGLSVSPASTEIRGDIVQMIDMPNRKTLEQFARTVQGFSPVDSHVRPEFGAMPGYEYEIIMAAGTFVQGSSIELSCDAPLREPLRVFFQGALTYQHARRVVAELAKLFIKPDFQ